MDLFTVVAAILAVLVIALFWSLYRDTQHGVDFRNRRRARRDDKRLP